MSITTRNTMSKIMNDTILMAGVCTIPAASIFLTPINTARAEKINNHTIFIAHHIIFVNKMNILFLFIISFYGFIILFLFVFGNTL